MKKILTLVAAMVCSLAAWATDYTGQLTVSVSGDATTSSQQEAVISINKTEAGYQFSLKNLVLDLQGQRMPVGSIIIDNLQSTAAFGYNNIDLDKNITIQSGDLEGIDNWYGPMLGEVPVKIAAKFNDQVLSVNIDITMAALGQAIKVSFIGTTPTPEMGDMNADGTINVTDVTQLINKILAQ